MGYGEYSGGGSVEWVVKHSNGHHGTANEHGGFGRDRAPLVPGGRFQLIVRNNRTGQVLLSKSYDVDDTSIEVRWDRHLLEPAPVDPGAPAA